MKAVFSMAALAAASNAYDVSNLPNVNPGDFKQLWVNNPIDHFNYQDKRTYQQRYWVND